MRTNTFLYMHQEIVKKIRKLRIEKGWSKQDMAEKLNIELSAYNRLESGKAKTWGKYFEELCQLFAINPSEFFKDISAAKLSLIQNQPYWQNEDEVE